MIELLLYSKSTGVILRDAFPALERPCTDGPFEDCKVRMFVKQRRTQSWSSYLPGKTYIYPTAKIVKSLHHYVRSQWKRFWLCIYAHCSNMRSQMLYTRGSFEICQERMFVKQRRKHRWNSYLLVALTELRKNVITYIVPRKTRKILFCMKNPKNLVCIKKKGKILLARGLSIQQLSPLGRWNVTLLLLLMLRKKCEYHRTCCDYLVAAACQDFSAWNERKKLQYFHQLALNMFWNFWKMYARTFRCLALLEW